jgi:hypothetical protein
MKREHIGLLRRQYVTALRNLLKQELRASRQTAARLESHAVALFVGGVAGTGPDSQAGARHPDSVQSSESVNNVRLLTLKAMIGGNLERQAKEIVSTRPFVEESLKPAGRFVRELNSIHAGSDWSIATLRWGVAPNSRRSGRG